MRKLLEKYKSLSPVAKAPIWYAFCSILQNGINFLTLPIFTELLTTEQYGLFTVYQSWMAILVIFTTLNLQYGGFNNAMVKYEQKREEYIASMQGLVLLLNFIFLLLYLIFRRPWNSMTGLPGIIMMAMFLEMTFTPALGFWSGKKRFEYKYRAVIAITVAMSFANPVVSVIAVMLSEDRGVVKVVAAALVNALFCFGIFIHNQYRGRKLFVKEYWKYALSFNLPLIPYYLSQMIFNQSDRIMINNMVGADKAAIYGVVYSCSVMIVFVINAINNAFVPWTYEQLGKKNYTELAKVSNGLSVFIGAVLLAVMLAAPEIIRLMTPAEYYEGIWVMPPIVCSLFFLFQAQLFINVEFYEEKKKYLVLGSIFSAVLNVGLNYWLIPIFGYMVTGYTTLAAYVVFSAANYYFMRKINQEAKASVYDMRFLVFFSVVMLAASGVILMSYYSIWLRAALLMGMLLIAFIFRKKLLGVMQNIRKK